MVVIFTRHDSKYQSYTCHSAWAHGYSHFLCKQNIDNLRLQCQSLRWNSQFWAASELHCWNTQLIIFFQPWKMKWVFPNNVATSMPKMRFFCLQENLFLLNMFPNSASCIESWISPTFFDWLLFIPRPRPLKK